MPYEELRVLERIAFLTLLLHLKLTQLVRKLEALSFIPRLLLGLVTNGDREDLLRVPNQIV